MGTLAKKLGQLTARKLETESARILREGKANKVAGSLSHALDSVLTEGGHNMQVFGLGTAASLSSLPRYARFTNAMYNVYSTMEKEFDQCSDSKGPSVNLVWARHANLLRRSTYLQQDLEDALRLLGHDGPPPVTPATSRYMEAIELAGERDRKEDSIRLLGHLYTRYFADLFGGQVLGDPTQKALGLPVNTPRHYTFSFGPDGRSGAIERIYESLNEAGVKVSEQQRVQAVDECRIAFKHNEDVYSEEPMFTDALRGTWNVVSGYVSSMTENLTSPSDKRG